MAAYMIFIREGEVFDQAAMDAYRSSNRQGAVDFRESYGLKPLAVYGQQDCFEGAAADGVVILEFPSAEKAKAWYFSPEYQAAAEWRKKAADYRAILVEGV